jgi:hypothetical protein
MPEVLGVSRRASAAQTGLAMPDPQFTIAEW